MEKEKKMVFRTPYTKNLIKEKACSKSEDFVENATPSLSELVDKFNRGQRLTGVNYGINPNFIPSGVDDGDRNDDLLPTDVIPQRINDIVEVEEMQRFTQEAKKELKKKKSTQQVNEQVLS